MSDLKKNKYYQEVYPFTTEMLSGYMNLLDLKGKNVLTVGSSSDQVFNAIMMGASKITLYDINIFAEDFFKLKKDMILQTPREKLVDKVLVDKSFPYSKELFAKKQIINQNPYLQSTANYKLLRERLATTEVSFILGDIFAMEQYLDKTAKFDRIIFSNILQALDIFAKKEKVDPFQFLRTNFEVWKEHLNKDGILQLLYLYNYSLNDLTKNNNAISIYNLKKVVDSLQGNPLEISFFEDSFSMNEDAIVTYTKK